MTGEMIVWADSSINEDDSLRLSELPGPSIMVSLGWVVKETARCVWLAGDVFRNPHKGSHLVLSRAVRVILKSKIITRTELKVTYGKYCKSD